MSNATVRFSQPGGHEVIDRDSRINFTWDGVAMSGFQGDTLASALLANGVRVVGRSFKYGRPRGIVSVGVEEPNALIALETGGYFTPNIKATEIELYEGLNARPATGKPSISSDYKTLFKPFHKFMPAGFYYKTFQQPKRLWPHYEELLRKMAGFSVSPVEPDAETYEHNNLHCDVAVIGGGVAGLAAALAVAEGGAGVVLIEERPALGGSWFTNAGAEVDAEPVKVWIERIEQRLQSMPNVQILTRTCAYALHDYNLIQALERVQDHLPLSLRRGSVRQRLHKIRPARVILATGAHERLIAFDNNDLPGIMQASAVQGYVQQHGVLPGEKIAIFTNNDSGYALLRDLHALGRRVEAIVDVRAQISGAMRSIAHLSNTRLISSAAVVAAVGSDQLKAVIVQGVSHNGDCSWREQGERITLAADLLAVSGGWSPVVHLDCHTGAKPFWSDEHCAFMPAAQGKYRHYAGSLLGFSAARDCQLSGRLAAREALLSLELRAADAVLIDAPTSLKCAPFFRAPDWKGKQFVDLQNDVMAKDIALAIRENFRSIEHIKRYTALGFGTDQGKTGNVIGVAIASEVMQKPMTAVGTTTYRPAYTPVTFGAMAGEFVGELFEPERHTPMHFWHLHHGAEWENVGQWKRPWYFPRKGESMPDALKRECLAVRRKVGMMDASTLGKIDVQGPDAREFLNRVLPNDWTAIKPGNCRYTVMLDDNGIVKDDGVTACLGDQHFLMTTTTGGAANMFVTLEAWLQTEWPDLKVFLTSVTDHWSTTAVVGEYSRQVLRSVCSDIDFDHEAFPFMQWRQGTIHGVPAMIMRISFSGELAYEVNVQANYGHAVWDLIHKAGQQWGMTLYGTESLHVLRAEKGFAIVGQDSDGAVSPVDLGMQWLLSKKKPHNFLGKRALARPYMNGTNRKQYVGLLTLDPQEVLPEGAQLIAEPSSKQTQGYVTSSYYSPILDHSIALAMLEGGREREGEVLYAAHHSGKRIAVRVCGTVFYDKEGARQNV
ncbi:sarcosine oxidase subunit alpha family protein [Pseudomonas sp. G2-4]|uniref:sarcosine oxidase subunit alpha family protein n=1 Tax=Pseudomonas sp. G2-4 TaxID=1506334 RepID=UPI0024B9F4FF|nr:sarcosine oxidase subunit alpha family protein [Pseudomonas sp. G2-4]WHS62434.1 sarcosine oxidase subunit alpha family protein [Pseudomonas sp. G2-4]